MYCHKPFGCSFLKILIVKLILFAIIPFSSLHGKDYFFLFECFSAKIFLFCPIFLTLLAFVPPFCFVLLAVISCNVLNI